MKFELVRLGDYFLLEKGSSYTSANLVDESDVGLLTINAFTLGGGYKPNSEKPFSGQLKDQYMLAEGDVLVATTEQDSGLLASPLVVKIHQTKFKSLLYSLDVAKVSSVNDEISPRFLFNILRIPAFRKRAAYGDTGSTVQRLPFEALYDLKIPKPPLLVQEAIIRLIDSIDEKIRTNEKITSDLEGIAQTIFKSWFIDFDPVKAKMAGEKPSGMDAATAALFPDSMRESELGLIPQGWNVRSIGDSVIKQKVGKLFDSKTSFPSGSVPVLDQGKSGVVGFHDEEPGVFASPEAPLVVFANHTCLLRLVSYPFSVIQNVFPLTGNKVDVIWLYFAVEGKQQFDSYKGHWPDFVLHKIIHPTVEATRAFRMIVEPLLKEKWLLEQQSKILGKIRDSLLPRLISGELQIPEEILAS
jgi:type I restriction enzyme S subunit